MNVRKSVFFTIYNQVRSFNPKLHRLHDKLLYSVLPNSIARPTDFFTITTKLYAHILLFYTLSSWIILYYKVSRSILLGFSKGFDISDFILHT